MSAVNEDRWQRIELALTNDIPHLKTAVARIDERTKGHGKLLALLLTMALTLGPAILVTVLVT